MYVYRVGSGLYWDDTLEHIRCSSHEHLMTTRLNLTPGKATEWEEHAHARRTPPSGGSWEGGVTGPHHVPRFI